MWAKMVNQSDVPACFTDSEIYKDRISVKLCLGWSPRAISAGLESSVDPPEILLCRTARRHEHLSGDGKKLDGILDSLVLFFRPVPANFCIFFLCDTFFFGTEASTIGGINSSKLSRRGKSAFHPFSHASDKDGSACRIGMASIAAARSTAPLDVPSWGKTREDEEEEEGSHGIDQDGRTKY